MYTRVTTQVWTVVGLIDVKSVLVMICQALAYKFFAAVRDWGLRWKLDLSSVQNSLVPYDSHLRLIMAEGFYSEKKLIKDDTHAPNVNLR